jgi:hypothetical protein
VRSGLHFGQGNRVNVLPADKACEEVIVPSSDLAAQAQRVLSRCGSQ